MMVTTMVMRHKCAGSLLKVLFHAHGTVGRACSNVEMCSLCVCCVSTCDLRVCAIYVCVWYGTKCDHSASVCDLIEGFSLWETLTRRILLGFCTFLFLHIR